MSADLPRPPRLAVALLRLCLPREESEVVAGDFEELFTLDRVPVAGRRAARRWYWRQVISVIASRAFAARKRASRASREPTLTTISQEVRYAWRTLRTHAGFTAIAIMSLAVGIGANVAVFALVHAVLWKPLPYTRPDELMMVHALGPDRETPGRLVQTRWSYPQYQVFQANQQGFSSTGIVLESAWNLSGGGSAIRVSGELIDARYLRVLGIAPLLGRDFTAAETAAPGSAPIAMIGEGLWRRRFGGDPSVLGRSIELAGTPHTVIGILPATFQGLTGLAEIWVPVTTQSAPILNEPWSLNYRLVARRAPGVNSDQAREAAARAAAAVERAFPNRPFVTATGSATAVSLNDERADPLLARAALFILGAVGVVLLIVCLNLAHLLLVRGLGRQRETAIRLALGASRRRIARQLMTENILLAVAGASAGLLVAYGFLAAGATLLPDLRVVLRGSTAGLTRVGLGMLGFDGTTLIFAIGAAIAATLLFGLVPAWRASHRDVTLLTKDGSAIGISRRPLGPSLVMVGELALSLMLLVAAGLMLKSTAHLLRTELGVRSDPMLTFRLSFPSPEYDMARATATIERLLGELGARREIEGVAFGNCAPVSGGCSATLATIPGQPTNLQGGGQRVGVYWASPSYFHTLGIPLQKGRWFSDRDRQGQPKVVVVSAAAARAIWPNADPIGKRVAVGQGGFGDSAEVIGVVGDVRYQAIETAATPDVYLPLLQSGRMGGVFFVRSRGSLALLAPIVRSTVDAVDANLPITDMKTMDDRLGDASWRTRTSAWLLGTFAAIAVFLSAIGVYGVVSQGVEQRRREIGVRMALGARRGQIVGLVLGRALGIGAAGVTAGLILAIPAASVLNTLLYEVSPRDPVVLGVLGALLLAIAVLASYLPARRAMRVDPLTTLRAE